MVDRLKGKVAIVTGGTLGIGLSIVDLYLKEGAKVVFTGRRQKIGEEAFKHLSNPKNAKFVVHDASNEEGWKKLFADVIAEFGKVDILVNNAGIGVPGDVEHTDYAQWRQTMAVNLDGVYFGTHYGVINMKHPVSGDASIINMSSIEGLVGDPNLFAYNATKGALRIMTKSAAIYCAQNDYNLRINTIHPGYIKTPLVEDMDGFEKAMSKRTKTPMGHIGDPEDIGWLAVYLGSEEAKFATGSEFTVDGGYTAQ
ncbi:SDR family oxidoreductase [Oenococcus oeni]|uniref:SDR family oxidoreductase n=1 Tax=Oenococcus oeni TaxID=1247 RepID=UPI00050F295E|nr:SDR family oxidoreductase [Oenococcus oeni]KGH54810.1 3-beta hydroxysteroid dehydrogenase [Oenococcus oeni IOEB_S277]KGH83263.1 3-beta hydroxysteroid dehydrogenase [Oenococcus oeni S15]KGH92772.1 3-beta hydroxysteroid dehydrogenase [Oenococcus oeni S161]PST70058.1 3-beta hydroxysteroid dehydrogenase [Oenococcus oeni]PST70755.1 3-beta hydroxysteroid dehydrogenase [Oenococcus oeni]